MASLSSLLAATRPLFCDTHHICDPFIYLYFPFNEGGWASTQTFGQLGLALTKALKRKAPDHGRQELLL